MNAYLQIDAFADRLEGRPGIAARGTALARLPAFRCSRSSNDIKHGTSHLLGVGRIEIGACCGGEHLLLRVTDNARLFQRANSAGWG